MDTKKEKQIARRTLLTKERRIATRDFLTSVLITGKVQRNSVIECIRAVQAEHDGYLRGTLPNYKLTARGLEFLEQWKDLV